MHKVTNITSVIRLNNQFNISYKDKIHRSLTSYKAVKKGKMIAYLLSNKFTGGGPRLPRGTKGSLTNID